jgi:hypothetical protein
MKKGVIATVLSAFCLMFVQPEARAQESTITAADTLVVIWTSGDAEVAEKMVFMYTHNAKKAGWFKEVIFIVWGPSAKLVSENEKIQERVVAMMNDGIIVEACVSCARMYGVDGNLKELGIDVKGMGTPLTKYLKSGYKILSL